MREKQMKIETAGPHRHAFKSVSVWKELKLTLKATSFAAYSIYCNSVEALVCEELQLHTAVSDADEKRSDISHKTGAEHVFTIPV